MRKQIRFLTVTVITATLSLSPAAAIEGSGPKVAGDLTIGVNIGGDVTNTVIGDRSEASVMIGVINEGEYGGNATITVDIKGGLSNTVKGNGSKGCVAVGVAGPVC